MNEPQFVVRVLGATRVGGESEFVGSGILVTPEHVLTCYHCCYHKGGQEKWESLKIESVQGGSEAEILGHCAEDDLVLLKLSKAIDNISCAVFVAPLNEAKWGALPTVWRACGYRSGQDLANSFRFTIVVRHAPPDVVGGFVRTQQLKGGLEEGSSGGAVVVETAGGQTQFLVIGILQLGGLTAATSRFLHCHRILAFLDLHIKDRYTTQDLDDVQFVPEKINISLERRRKLEQLNYVSVRILLAAYGPIGDGVANLTAETSRIKATLHSYRAALEGHISVEFYEWRGTTAVPIFPDTEKTVSDIKEFDLILTVVWNSFGENGGLEKLTEASEAASTNRSRSLRLRRWFFRRQDQENVGDSDESRWDRIQNDKKRLDRFFRRLRDDASVMLEEYSEEVFPQLFGSHIWRFVGAIIDEAIIAGPHTSAESRTAFVNPYLGLDAYTKDDAERFFGRDAEASQLCSRFVGRSFLAVIGASGSGKSSLVRAGLLPLLKWGAITNSDKWKMIDFSVRRDTRSPIRGLAGALYDFLGNCSKNSYPTASDLEEHLRSDQLTALTTIRQPLLEDAPSSERLVILIDQFEELFTLVTDPGELAAFVEVLGGAAKSDWISILITLRVDYYGRALDLGPLAEFMRDGVYSVPVPDRKALLAMITEPAAFAGLRFEPPNLPSEILKDLGAGPGVLPLLSYALQQLTQLVQESGHVISRDTYDKLGRSSGLIQRKAAEAMEKVKWRDSKQFEKETSILFSSLVRAEPDGKAAKKPADYDRTDRNWTDELHKVIEGLIKQRLLRAEEGTIELSHETLLTDWEELRKWIEEAHEGLLLLRRLSVEAKEWDEKVKQAPDKMAEFAVHHEWLWEEPRLQKVAQTLEKLGKRREQLAEWEIRFIRPERTWLEEELALPVDHGRRAEIGDRLAKLGDTREGVGVTSNRLPDIQWCLVGPGEVTIQGWDKPLRVNQFYLAKYPVTLAQFNLFADSEEEYYQEVWWEGLPVSPYKHQPYPQNLDISNHPAQFVSWYQAIAYCRWLSAKVDLPIRLPTEWEWQRAATGGRQSYAYPWGAEWDSACANTNEGGRDSVVSVGLYPRGNSPEGVADLSGNMYEWCLNKFDDLTVNLQSPGRRTTRGGAYFVIGNQKPKDLVKVTHRLGDNPDGWNDKQRIRVCIRLARDYASTEPAVGQ